MTNELASIPPLQTALALAVESGDIEGMKDVRAMATALQKGAKARGMGIESENAAAEVVLRSERAIGQVLIRLKDEGLVGPNPTHRTDTITEQLVLAVIEKPLITTREAAERVGIEPAEAAKFLAETSQVQHDGKAGDNRGLQVRWSVNPAERERRLGTVTLKELGISDDNSSNFQQLARIPDDMFERMLNEAKNLRERIAKVNFYRKPADPKKEGPATKDESGWDEFQRGANTLLGWHVDEDGQGRFTKNGLLQLPNDQLLTLAVIVRELVRCYQEVKDQR